MLYAVTLVLCVALRVVPHPYNLTPLGASAVFAGRNLPLPWSIALTWVGMFIANLALARVLGYPVMDGSMPFVFAGFGFQAFLGWVWRRTRGGAFLAAGAGSVVFFLVSNLGTFISTPLYPHTPGGLLACFVAALPFYRGTFIGDFLWTAALIPLYRWAANRSVAGGAAAPAMALVPGSGAVAS